MLRLSVPALLAGAALTTASPSPGFFSDALSKLTSAAETTAHKFIGQKACPSPLLLPPSCAGGKPVTTVLGQPVDACCTNVDTLSLATQFWDAQPATGPEKSWTVHGLWPDYCDGTYPAFCDASRQYTDIRGILESKGETELLDFMDTYWKDYQGDDNSFWSHEWDKHGTCLSSLNTTCYGKAYKQYDEVVDYFERAVSLFKSLPTYDWLAADGIVPSETATYTLEQLQAVAKKHHSGFEIYWGCSDGALSEAWYYFVTKGPIAGGKFIPAQMTGSSSCPATGIRYLPKVQASGGGSGSGSGSGSSGNDTKAFFDVLVDGTSNGFLISKGTWYSPSGTPAGYYLTPTDSSVTTIASGVEFTMHTSKGNCDIVAEQLSCADGNEAGVFSLTDDLYLSYADSAAFYATTTPSGSTQVNVGTAEQAVEVRILYSPQ
ncbi:hypothetical protein JCM10213_004728 [Rhodosporidiobolus nylandii]